MTINYDRISQTYDEHRSWEEEVPRRLLSLASGEATDGTAPILEIGCGTGNVTQWIVKHWTGCVIAIDASRGMLSKAAGKVPQARLIQADAGQLPLQSNAFAGALGSFVLHHLKSGERAGLFAGLHRVLRDTGRSGVAFVTASHAQIRATYLNRWFPSIAEVDCARFPDISVLSEELRDAGFSNIATEGFSRRQPRGDASVIQRVRSRFMSSLELIPEAEFSNGVAEMERQIARDGHLGDVSWYATIISAQR
ncbi:MAG TPA: methyltransferase domain-containing protein [Planctomycetota bacterium]|nr:methyltransferase domain-containing protein [Planctomycetota bacterium]